jgi:hypothetical protein
MQHRVAIYRLSKVGEFLVQKNYGPQHGELLRLIGTRISQEPAGA